MNPRTTLEAVLAAWLCGASPGVFADLTVLMHLTDEKGVADAVGQIVVSETPHGIVFAPALTGLPPGLHGFHVHENPSCMPGEKEGKTVPGLAAGGHFDPQKTGRHGVPWGSGHLGDLPALFVDADGRATHPVLAPRLKLSDLSGRALMIHAGGDNYADEPLPLGGGGARLACGVVE